MDLNSAIDNFKRAYDDLMSLLEEEPTVPVYEIIAKPPSEQPNYKLYTDIGIVYYRATGPENAKNQFRTEHGYNHIRIHKVQEI